MYKLSRLAAEDFRTIYEYTLLNLTRPDAYTDDLDNVLRLLAGAPLMGPECQEIADGVRRHDPTTRHFLPATRKRYFHHPNTPPTDGADETFL
ncbi:MAG: type II toxin-antitoxin system RelE/ParE family toxin [Alcanivorax sp.]|uniref:type II toxin-antitoxin system RelE/ParE family toxin n=1 Tax=Alcanivorax sp. TaxID=1872427 RepID=UPI003DA75F2C